MSLINHAIHPDTCLEVVITLRTADKHYLYNEHSADVIFPEKHLNFIIGAVHLRSVCHKRVNLIFSAERFTAWLQGDLLENLVPRDEVIWRVYCWRQANVRNALLRSCASASACTPEERDNLITFSSIESRLRMVTPRRNWCAKIKDYPIWKTEFTVKWQGGIPGRVPEGFQEEFQKEF